MYGEPYWDEETVYAFTLEEIETRIEDPSTELHAMCREAAARIVESEELLTKLDIPEAHWDLVRSSWRAGEGELYGRFDLIYDGTGPASMIEYNADTPTSLYESASFQWKWFEDQRERGVLPAGADQFNRIYEALSERFATLFAPDTMVHFTSVGGEANREDFSTVEFLAYAARDAGLGAQYVALDQIGLTTEGQFADAESRVIGALFKLYPWEDMLRDEFARHIAGRGAGSWSRPGRRSSRTRASCRCCGRCSKVIRTSCRRSSSRTCSGSRRPSSARPIGASSPMAGSRSRSSPAKAPRSRSRDLTARSWRPRETGPTMTTA
jgi:glutathionylspermidine synthase